MSAADFILITCEHGGNNIPSAFRALFREYQRLLRSHRGYDAGALQLAKDLARTFDAPLVASTVSRLLVDLNRSLHHARVFSEPMAGVTAEQRKQIAERYYYPHRAEVQRHIETAVARQQRVVHLACHSFTPTLDGVKRRADVGLLYDPGRAGEVALCSSWKEALRTLAPALQVRRNYPYVGKNDGLTTFLRKRFAPSAYVGVEIEINQKHVFADAPAWGRLRRVLILSLMRALADRHRR